ncbi:MAG TPA: glycoside hydrolase family 57 protein [Candidatus Saccharimonadales bacterium]|nr:glycoside hydrolase family 57 protein [Candidatus Saccharimonadales bacterium]
MNKAIVLYLHVHQPYRIRHYTIFDAGVQHNYFNAPKEARENNETILHKVAEKSYLPTNQRLLRLLHEHPEFKLSLSITGTLLEQLETWAPEVLTSFQELVATGRVEIVGETYHHSLAFFYSREEFEMQVRMHQEIVERLFSVKPTAFRNTELAYNNDVAVWADNAGYNAILCEGWDPVLGWRSPNYVYQPAGTQNIRLLMKNYRLSDDIAFRFGDREWNEWPLTADKFAHWLSEDKNATNFDLFMDYETFGEHQWHESGIFKFLEHLPCEWLKSDAHKFMTVSEAASEISVSSIVDVPHTITWADTERDLSAWVGNNMQQEAIAALYQLEKTILNTNDLRLIEDWRKLQTSDHFYYMCTKWFNDGDIHAYFSPYETPYEAYINFMNAYHDLRFRLIQKGVNV